MRFIVNVRYNSCQPVPLEVECLSTVLTLKEKISIRYQLPADEIRIIFQGRELSNDVTFEVGIELPVAWPISLFQCCLTSY